MDYKIWVLMLIALLHLSCEKEQKDHVDVSGINVNCEVIRFEQKFYNSNAENLPELKRQYSYLFPEREADSVWLNKMKDEDELFLFQASQSEFQDFEIEKRKLTSLFKHVKYYYPRFTEPKIVTILSNVDYENKVIYADSLLFIALDTYLGSEHEVYEGYPNYIKENFNKSHLPVDVAEQLAAPIIRPALSKTFVSKMIQEGKKMKLMESYLPEVEKNELMGYTPQQLNWAEVSEGDIWKYFIQKEMLYSSESELSDRFIKPAPFSKFYLEVDQDSPGRIGVWFGWQIVNSFMNNNGETLQEMINIDNEELFKRSKYKPRKNQ